LIFGGATNQLVTIKKEKMESNKLDKQIAKFILEKPLYTKWKLDGTENRYLMHDNSFENTTFTFFCEKDESVQTFILIPNPKKYSSPPPANSATTSLPKEKSNTNWRGEEESFQAYLAECQGCRKYYLRFEFRFVRKDDECFIQKIGQLPSFKKEIDTDLRKFLNEESIDCYEKALMNLSTGYGIGAFAYLRRVIEREIDKLIEEVSKIESEYQEEILEAMRKYEKTKQKAKLIDEIFPYLPSPLKNLGDNPIRLLYDQLSIGIHAWSDEECVGRSLSIDEIFKRVVKELNKEKNETQKVIEAIKQLKK